MLGNELMAKEAMKRFPHRRGFLEELIIQAVAVGGLLLSLRLALKYLDPYREQRETARKRAAFLKKVLGRSLDLNEFEQLLAANVINPKYIDVTLEDVSGLDELIEELEVKVLMPMIHPELYCTSLWKPAKGVLLYGPPGTGKTMLAKALAKHSGCYFLNITASSIMSKWLGDANRLVRAIFTLAEKLQPCIIFIDEVDSLLGKRGLNQEHEASLQVKTEFMQLWDGMESSKGQRVVVMGATNRPGIVDEAVLRRFSVQHEVGLPDVAQRRAILRSYLRRHVSELGPGAVDPALLAPPAPTAPTNNNDKKTDKPTTSIFNPLGSKSTKSALTNGGSTQGVVDQLSWLASNTPGFSGSDLMELCSQAAQRVLSEYLSHRKQRKGQPAGPGPATEAPDRSGSSGGSGSGNGRPAAAALQASSADGDDDSAAASLRELNLGDFKAVLLTMKASSHKADEYSKRVGLSGGGTDGPADMGLLLQLMARMAQASQGNEP